IKEKQSFLYKTWFENSSWSRIIKEDEWFEEYLTILDNLKMHYTQYKARLLPGIFNTLASIKNMKTYSDIKVIFVAKPQESFEGMCFSSEILNIENEEQRVIKEVSKTSYEAELFRSIQSRWIKEGVMFLPTSFTSGKIHPKNHELIWESCIENLIRILDDNIDCVWVLVGEAKKFKNCLKISNLDMEVCDFTERNLPKLVQLEPFKKINDILENMLRVERIVW